jgi:PAS domain-containing protein
MSAFGLHHEFAKVGTVRGGGDYSDDAVIGKTLDGVITSWNHGAERLYGYTPGEAIGKSIALLLPPSTAATLALGVLAGSAQADGSPVYGNKTISEGLTGQTKFLFFTHQPTSSNSSGVAHGDSRKSVTRDFRSMRRLVHG